MVDIILVVFFSLTSFFMWLPMVVFLFLPFYVSKKIKRKLLLIADMLEKYTDIKLNQYRQFKHRLTFFRNVEKKTKFKYSQFSDMVYQKLVWHTRLELIKNVPRGAKVLDIGCGNGYLAKLLTDTKKAKVICCDVVDYNKSGLNTVIYDGEHLPFSDKTFDIVLFSYVLHHSRVPDRLLSEAARVCKGNILIYEDLAPIGKKMLALAHQSVYNYFYNLDSPVTYYSRSEWFALFERIGLQVANENLRWSVGSILFPIKSAFFVLKSKN